MENVVVCFILWAKSRRLRVKYTVSYCALWTPGSIFYCLFCKTYTSTKIKYLPLSFTWKVECCLTFCRLRPSPRRPVFHPKLFYVGFVVIKVATGQVQLSFSSYVQALIQGHCVLTAVRGAISTMAGNSEFAFTDFYGR